MSIELSAEEIEMIAGWYYSCAWESATTQDAEMFALLDKLGIQADPMDLCPPSLQVIKSHKPVVHAKRAAIAAYMGRHPEIKA